MSSHPLNYDKIASEYDRRYDNLPLQDRGKALLALAGRLRPRRVLEAGCGTGHWLAAMHSVAPHLFGLDLSQGMLNQARKRGAGLGLVRGTAVQLPFRQEQFDLIVCIDAIHHFSHPRGFIAEAFRALRPGGALAILYGDPRHGVWYVYSYFENVYAADLARFPVREELVEWMTAAGFEQVDLQTVEEVKELCEGRRILENPFLRKNSCSQLALLSDEAYQAGIAGIENALREAEARGEKLSFRTELSICMAVAYKHSA